jgi:hypothetical protein
MKWMKCLTILFLFLTIGQSSAADKDTLVIGLAADAMSMDPHNVTETPSYNV